MLPPDHEKFAEGFVRDNQYSIAESKSEKRYQLQFTGDEAEYFQIWLMNLFLNIITVGFYSPWAKVRRLKYFYQHTLLDGSSFDYHGDPYSILVGRLIAIAMLMAYNFSLDYSLWLWLASVVLIGSIMPWLLRRSLMFRLRNTSYRGLRFHFRGSSSDAYIAYLGRPFLALISFTILTPWAFREYKNYQFSNAFYGKTPFAFSASTKEYTWQFFVLGAAYILAFVGIGTAGALAIEQPVFWLAVVPFYFLLILGGQAITLSGFHNLTWNSVTLDGDTFSSEATRNDIFFILLKNFLFSIFTLGFYRPYAAIRLARYRIEAMTLTARQPLDRHQKGVSEESSALGEEFTDIFDFDISL